jgi:hypothetical protein
MGLRLFTWSFRYKIKALESLIDGSQYAFPHPRTRDRVMANSKEAQFQQDIIKA